MRYVAKWNNGYWKLFDQSSYRDVDFFYLKSAIDEVVARLNKE